MDTIKIRAATINDIDVLLDFEQGVIKAERPFDVTLGADPITYYDLEDLIASDEASLVVAEIKGEIIGSGYALVKPARHYLNHGFYSYLGFMYTLPEYRGRGVNTMIIDELKQWSDSKGLKEIRLTVYDENLGAIKAYEKTGFKKHIIEMRLA